MGKSNFCIVCGSKRDEVWKLHNFTQNREKALEWAKNMGIVITGILEGETIRHYQICSDHFEKSCYLHAFSKKLNHNAVPTLKPACLDSPAAHGSSRVAIVEEVARAGVAVREEHNYFSEVLTDAQHFTSKNPIEKNEELHIEHIFVDVLQCMPSEFTELSFTFASTLSPPPKILQNIKPIFKKIEPDRQLTRKKWQLLNNFLKKEDQLRRLKKNYKNKKLASLCHIDDSFMKEIFPADLPSSSVKFLIAEVRWFKRPKRNWSLDDKLQTLRLFQRNSHFYFLLRRFFPLPPRSSLVGVLRNFFFKPGINNNLFQHLSEVLKDRMNGASICSLLFAEMPIKQLVDYDFYSDTIMGLEGSCKPADRVLVFMLQGCLFNWKQPVAYYFNKGPFSLDLMELILSEVLDACAKYNLDVIVAISKLENFKIFANLGPFIETKKRSIPVMFDPPQLLLATRNLFKKYPIEFFVGEDHHVAKWEHIKSARDVDKKILSPESHILYLSKITDWHLYPAKENKKVKLASQIFSNTMAAFMLSSLTAKNLSSDCLGTAYFLGHMDILFDSLNGSSSVPEPCKDVRCMVTEKSPHWKYWEEVYSVIQQWRFQRHNSLKPPTQIAWLQTIKTFSSVCKHLILDRGFESVRPRQFNLDALENFFVAIKSGRDLVTARQFCDSFKTQILTGLMSRLQGSDREDDGASILSDCRSLLRNIETTSQKTKTGDATVFNCTIDSAKVVNEISKVISGKYSNFSVVRFCAVIAKQILKDLDCAKCVQALTANSQLVQDLYFYVKELSPVSNVHYPCEQFVKTVAKGINILKQIMPALLREPVEIRERAIKYLYAKLEFDWYDCLAHTDLIKDCIVGAVVRVGVEWYIRRFKEN